MTETFTQRTDSPVKPAPQGENNLAAPFAEPSKSVIQNILNYSKNLEIKASRFMPPIEVLKS